MDPSSSAQSAATGSECNTRSRSQLLIGYAATEKKNHLHSVGAPPRRSEPKPNLSPDFLSVVLPDADNQLEPSSFEPSTVDISDSGNTACVKDRNMQSATSDKNDPAMDNSLVDECGGHTRVLSFNDEFLDCAFFPDPIFDDPGIRSMFTDAALSRGVFWHKETSQIVEEVAEIPERVYQVLNRAVSAGLSSHLCLGLSSGSSVDANC